MDARFARFINIGTPRSGKSTFWDLLTGKEVNYSKESESTGTATYCSQIVLNNAVLDTDNVWYNLDHAGEVSLIKNIFSYVVGSSSLTASQSTISTNSSSPLRKDSSQATDLSSSHEQSDVSTDTDFDFLENVLSFIDGPAPEWERVKNKLEEIILLSSVDTGGHAEFQDMHASLISGPSFNLLFHKLCDKLDEKFDVHFTKDGTSTRHIKSDSTVKDVLLQALASVACFGNSCGDDGPAAENEVEEALQSYRSRVMFVGTFLDRLTESDLNGELTRPELTKRNQDLEEMIKETYFADTNFVRGATEDQLILAVGEKCGMKRDDIQKLLSSQLRDFTEKKIKIPAKWLLLSLCLRLANEPIMSLERCKDFAEKLQINDLELALKFLHHVVGVLHYYPDVPEVKDKVFCQVQVVYDCVTKIILAAYDFKKVDRNWKKFRDTGCFFLEDIEKKDDSSVPLRDFVKILEYLNIIAAMPPDPKDPDHKEKFFMPCVLHSLSNDKLVEVMRNDKDSMYHPPNLMLRYECGYTPVGVFPALITNLVYRQEKLKWEMKLEEDKRFKNMVRFRRKNGGDIYLASHLQYFEIAFYSPSSTSIESTCTDIRKIIISTIEVVIENMNYKFNMDYQFGFECPGEGEHPHLKLALLHKELDPEALCYMECSDCDKQFHVQENHRMWFEDYKEQGNGNVHACMDTSIKALVQAF